MIDLRALLIDCRVALRALPGKSAQPLLQRLEIALTEVGKSGVQTPASGSQIAQQVALAWQTAARGLKHSRIEVYEELNARVMTLLGERTLFEPTEELLALTRKLEEMSRERERINHRLQQAKDRQRSAQIQLAELHSALAAAVPECAGADVQSQALTRLQMLQTQAAAPAAASAVRAQVEREGPVPSRLALERIASGAGSFNKEQRDWVIGETLGLTGWEYTPVELIEKGDQWLATLLLEKGIGG
jgi:hypothetical protein